MSDTQHRVYIIGTYIHHNSNWVASTVKEEVKQIMSNFIEPKIIVEGDLNDSFTTINRKLFKLGMRSFNLGPTRFQPSMHPGPSE